MRIDSSVVGMESARSYTSVSARMARISVSRRQLTYSGEEGALFGNLLQSDVNDKDAAAQNAAANTQGNTDEGETTIDALSQKLDEMRAKFRNNHMGITGRDLSEQETALKSIRQNCFNFLIDLLFPNRRSSFSSMLGEDTGNESQAFMQDENAVMASTASVKTVSFDFEYLHEESETTSFSTQGKVVCADGRELDFNLNLEMSRSFSEYYSVNYQRQEVTFCDPLVINLDGNIAELSDQTFLFDIDADGTRDEVSMLNAASGYLALDKNEDGTINDGSELFGTASGNGFSDLAAYDQDGNGWIDEGDEIWNKLKVWQMNEDGSSTLCGLTDKGIGAICLQNASTDFALNNAANEAKGMVRNTGVFLYENGMAGTIQHVDVAKYNQVS